MSLNISQSSGHSPKHRITSPFGRIDPMQEHGKSDRRHSQAQGRSNPYPDGSSGEDKTSGLLGADGGSSGNFAKYALAIVVPIERSQPANESLE